MEKRKSPSRPCTKAVQAFLNRQILPGFTNGFAAPSPPEQTRQSRRCTSPRRVDRWWDTPIGAGMAIVEDLASPVSYDHGRRKVLFD
ncbi:hypothetical protein MRX96_017939 [Rhipicephalus microplus]